MSIGIRTVIDLSAMQFYKVEILRRLNAIYLYRNIVIVEPSSFLLAIIAKLCYLINNSTSIIEDIFASNITLCITTVVVVSTIIDIEDRGVWEKNDKSASRARCFITCTNDFGFNFLYTEHFYPA